MTITLAKTPATRELRRAMARYCGLRNLAATAAVHFRLIEGEVPPVLTGSRGGLYSLPSSYKAAIYLRDRRCITAGTLWALRHGWVPEGEMGALAALCVQAEGPGSEKIPANQA
jgi:hypothetical protein